MSGLFKSPMQRLRQKYYSDRISEIAGGFTIDEVGTDLYLSCNGVGLRKFSRETTVGEVMDAIGHARKEAIGYYNAKYEKRS